MTLRSSLAVFGIGTLLAWGAWLLVLFTVPPDATGPIGEVFFFSALFLAIAGTLTILGVLGRAQTASGLPSLYLGSAFRQGILIALAAIAALALQRFHVLRWWNILAIVSFLILIDVVLTGRRRSHTV